ncbi:thermonuclease family protein [Halopseudomonas salegens]|uniref:Endonuclease YncB, thermonuclease family n=1 Tax=Halopseudomonas salegens TaxID=1434072 RepID=A0A1H2H7J1_9GAMM|nr:thermonuclease family protein [Halopseudomonas salegens]SDU27772.1 Endonuclease YncB, thermonuclease family [Halopseudomonas salegens]
MSAFFLSAICQWGVADTRCQATATTEPVKLMRVIDGDTVELSDGRRVRLIGLDTPEIGYRGEPSEPFALAARDRLRELVVAGELRMQVGEEAEDRYGRTLGHLFTANGSNVEARLLAEGLGFALAVPPNTALWRCQAAAEAQARQQGLALWGVDPVRPASQLRSGGFALIRGKVTSIDRAGKQLWIELDGPLVLRLRDTDRQHFAGLRPEAWQGREMEVRGWVIERGSRRPGRKPLLLPLEHPGMLKLLTP